MSLIVSSALSTLHSQLLGGLSVLGITYPNCCGSCFSLEEDSKSLLGSTIKANFSNSFILSPSSKFNPSFYPSGLSSTIILRDLPIFECFMELNLSLLSTGSDISETVHKHLKQSWFWVEECGLVKGDDEDVFLPKMLAVQEIELVRIKPLRNSMVTGIVYEAIEDPAFSCGRGEAILYELNCTLVGYQIKGCTIGEVLKVFDVSQQNRFYVKIWTRPFLSDSSLIQQSQRDHQIQKEL